MKKQKYGEGPDFSRKYTAAVRAVVGTVSDGVRTTVRTDLLTVKWNHFLLVYLEAITEEQ